MAERPGIIRPGQRRTVLPDGRRPAPREQPPPTPEPEWLTQDQVAKLVGRAPRTVRNWRALGVGPPWHTPAKVHLPRYKRDEVEAWMRGWDG
jgi:hypothetical protein